MPRRASRPLVLWSAALLVLLAAHDLSHVLDDALDTKVSDLALIAIPQWIALAVVFAVILRAERARAAAAAFLLGVGVTVGFLAIHLLPFSPADYYDLDPSAISWVLAWLPAALGVVVAARAWSEWRAAGALAAPRVSSA